MTMTRLPHNYPRNICAYCGATENLTDDHVPPRNLFPKPRPSYLITVPACTNCHSNTSKDDEYFRINLCLHEEAGDHPSAKANWGSIFRSLKRAQAKGLKKQFIKDIHNVQLRTASGLYLGNKVAYDVDLGRIRNVVERTIRGLYFAECSLPLGFDNEIEVYTNEDLELQNSDILDQLKRDIVNPLAAMTPKSIGDNVFLYRHQIIQEIPILSVWIVSFYEKVPFLCMTGPMRSA